jgi:hypothetical protein
MYAITKSRDGGELMGDENQGWISWWRVNYCYFCLNSECKRGYSDIIACQWRNWAKYHKEMEANGRGRSTVERGL